MKKIILGSGSPRRRELLQQIGIEFEVMVSGGEECYQSSGAKEIVRELARLKAHQTAEMIEDKKEMIIIGADTVVALDDQILGKPADEEDAFKMISELQGRSHHVYTGVALLVFDSEGSVCEICHAEETEVFVHAMEANEIFDYIATGEPADKAGAYGIQGKFAAYIDRIEGDYYNVVGLPVAWLYRQLRKWAK